MAGQTLYPYCPLREDSEFFYRLPWPLMDITTVKIPVQWLPPACYRQYRKRRRQFLIKQRYLLEHNGTTTTEPEYWG